jgi:hypothetical protein
MNSTRKLQKNQIIALLFVRVAITQTLFAAFSLYNIQANKLYSLAGPKVLVGVSRSSRHQSSRYALAQLRGFGRLQIFAAALRL